MGHRPIATCSPRNFALARSYGADDVFDYNLPDCADRIRTATRGGLRFALDPFTDTRSIALCYGALGLAGGRYACLDMYPDYLPDQRRAVKVGFVMGPALLGHRLALDHGYERDADPDMRAFGVRWYATLQRLLDRGALRPHPLRVLDGAPGPFDAILKGVDMLKSKAVSGEKLVVVIDDQS